MLTWRTKVPAYDAIAAEIAKFEVVAQPNGVSIGGLMRIEQLAQAHDAAALAHVLRSNGIDVGIGFYNMQTTSLDGVAWAPPASSGIEPQLYSNTIGAYRLHTMVRIPNHAAYFGLLATIEATRDTNWYIMATEPAMQSDTEPNNSDAPPRPYVERMPTRQPTTPVTPKSDGSSRSRSSSESSTTSGESDGQYMSRAIPAALQKIDASSSDVVLATLVDRATGGNKFVSPAMTALAKWQIPQQLTGDDTALQWLAEALPRYLSCKGDSAVDMRVDALRLNIAEQIRLNAERKYAAAQVAAATHLQRPDLFASGIEAANSGAAPADPIDSTGSKPPDNAPTSQHSDQQHTGHLKGQSAEVAAAASAESESSVAQPTRLSQTSGTDSTQRQDASSDPGAATTASDAPVLLVRSCN